MKFKTGFLVYLSVVFLITTHCTNKPSNQVPKNISFSTLKNGEIIVDLSKDKYYFDKFSKSRAGEISNTTELEKYLKDYKAILPPSISWPIPTLNDFKDFDFTKNKILGISMDADPSRGHIVSVLNVIESADNLEIHVTIKDQKEVKPLPNIVVFYTAYVFISLPLTKTHQKLDIQIQ